MASVTSRIKQIKQPYGGYLKISEFQEIEYNDNETLQEENIHSSLVGLVVDYLTRFALGTPVEEAFRISLDGAKIIGENDKALGLLSKITGIDAISIYNACKLVGYDVCFRAGTNGYKNVDEINADENTINNIRIMIKRSVSFFDKYGPIIKDGFNFYGGYTDLINSGDGDFLTKDTLWDFKVLSNKPKSSHTLQILIYYIMGKHSIHKEFDDIKNIGIFNPRTNTVYLKNANEIPNEIIEEISKNVIGYSGKNRSKPSTNTTKKQELKNPDMLTVTEVMKILHCSRYMVMKYYSEKDLPLTKIGNKYYISKSDLLEWLEKMEKEKKLNMIFTICFLIVFLVVVIFVLFFFPKLFPIKL